MSTPADRRRRPARARRRWTVGLLGGLLVAGPVVALPTAAEAAPRVTWSQLSVVAGKKVTATVKPGSVPDGAQVVLQRKFPDRWRTADPTAKRAGGGLQLQVPTKQYGSFVYRVAAVDGTEVVDTSDNATVRVRPPYSPAGPASAYDFMASPRWQWDSCRTITWKFNPSGSPRGGLKQLKGAVARIHAATGLEFVYAGKTKQTPRFQGVKGTDVIVGWLGRRAFARKYGNIVGVGGASYSPGWKLPGGASVSRAVRGGVVLNARWKSNLSNGFGRGYTWGEVLMHELGHVIGLDHVGNDKQLMYDTVTPGAARFGAGDLTGFRKIGDSGGCLVPKNARALESPRLIAHAP
jgi:hypothetical protein